MSCPINSASYSRRGRSSRILATVAALICLLTLLPITVPFAAPPQEYDSLLLYDGYRLYQDGQNEKAIAAFKDLLERYPNSKLGDLALFWTAKSYLRLNQPAEAKTAFLELKKRYPNSRMLAEANDQLALLEKVEGAPSVVAKAEEPKLAPEQAAAEKLAAEQAAAEKLAAEKLAAEKAAAEKLAAEKAAAEQAAAEKLAAEKAAAEQAAAEKLAAEKAAAEQAAAEKLAAEKAAAEQAAAEKLAAEKAAAEQAAAEKLAAEKAAAEQAAAEKLAAEKAAAEKAAAEKLAAEKAAAEQAAAEKLAAEKAAAEKAAAEKLAAEKAAAKERIKELQPLPEVAPIQAPAEEKPSAKERMKELQPLAEVAPIPVPSSEDIKVAAAIAAAQEKAAAREKAALEQKLAKERELAEKEARQKAALEKKVAAQKAATEKAAAEKASLEQKLAEKKAAAQKTAEEKEALRQKLDEEKLATQKTAEEKAALSARIAEEKSALEKASAEKNAMEQKLAREKAASDKAEQEMAALEKAISDRKAAAEAAATAKATLEQKLSQEQSVSQKTAEEKAALAARAAEEKAVMDKAMTEKAALEQKLVDEKAAAKKAAEEKAALEQKLVKEKAAADKAEQELASLEKTLSERKVATDKVAGEKAVLEQKLAAERAAAQKAAEEKAALAAKAAEEKAAMEKATAEKVELEQKLAEETAAAKNASREKAALEKKIAADKAAAEKAAAEKAALERRLAEKIVAAQKVAEEMAALEKKGTVVAKVPAAPAKKVEKKPLDDQRRKAIENYKRIVRESPGSALAAKARARLKELGEMDESVTVAQPSPDVPMQAVTAPLGGDGAEEFITVTQTAGLTIATLKDKLSTYPGEIAIVPLRITNTGNAEDSFRLEGLNLAGLEPSFFWDKIEDGALQPFEPQITVTPPIGSQKSLQVLLVLHTSQTLADGESKDFEVRASSLFNTSVGQVAKGKLMATAPILRGVVSASVEKTKPSENISYTVNYSNQGSAAVQRGKLSLTYPPHLIFVSASPAPSDVNLAADSLIWNVEDMKPLEEKSVTATFRVKEGTPSREILYILSEFTDAMLNKTANFKAASTKVEQVAGVKLTGHAADRPAVPGDVLYLPFVVTNSGNGPDAFALSTKGADSAKVVVYGDPNKDQFHQQDEPVVSETPTLLPGESYGAIIEVKIPAGKKDGEKMSIALEAQSKLDRKADAMSAREIGISVPIVASLTQIRVKDVAPGRLVAYQLTCENLGSGLARNIQLTDQLPAELEFVDADPLPAKVENGTVTWFINELQPHQKRSISVNVKVRSGISAGKALKKNTVTSYYDMNGNVYK